MPRVNHKCVSSLYANESQIPLAALTPQLAAHPYSWFKSLPSFQVIRNLMLPQSRVVYNARETLGVFSPAINAKRFWGISFCGNFRLIYNSRVLCFIDVNTNRFLSSLVFCRSLGRQTSAMDIPQTMSARPQRAASSKA